MAPEHMASEAAIREQAYYFWEQDGRPQGRDMEYWQRASVAVAGQDQLSTLTKAPPKQAKAPATKASKGGPATKLKAAASTIRGAPAKMVKAKDTPKAKPKKK
jgi:hypothetical protein